MPSVSKWAMLGDAGASLCILDWIKLGEVNGSPSGLHVNTLGRIGSVLSPRELASLNYEKLFLAVIVDFGYNFMSFRRQESADNLKGVADIRCESSVRMAALMSLSGVGSLVSQRWATSLTSQQRFITSFWQTALVQKLDLSSSFASGSQPKPAVRPISASVSRGKPAAASSETEATTSPMAMKRWIKLARVFYGSTELKVTVD
jgi:hypothetical protein